LKCLYKSKGVVHIDSMMNNTIITYTKSKLKIVLDFGSNTITQCHSTNPLPFPKSKDELFAIGQSLIAQGWKSN